MSIELSLLETIDKNIKNAYNNIQIEYATV